MEKGGKSHGWHSAKSESQLITHEKEGDATSELEQPPRFLYETKEKIRGKIFGTKKRKEKRRGGTFKHQRCGVEYWEGILEVSGLNP